MTSCPRCGKEVVQPKRGAPKKWCSARCRRDAWDEAQKWTCRNCGASRTRQAQLCSACWTSRRGVRDSYMAERWRDGLALWEIALELQSTANAIGVRLCQLRKRGWDLPYRSHSERGRVNDEDRGVKDLAALAIRRPKLRAISRLNNAVALGHIERPAACERCGSDDRVEGHHHDYSKPLDVEWLCFTCHRQEHGQLQVAA